MQLFCFINQGARAHLFHFAAVDTGFIDEQIPKNVRDESFNFVAIFENVQQKLLLIILSIGG